MISEYIGVVYVKGTEEIRMIINPDYDEALNDPSLVENESENLEIMKIPRKHFGKMSIYDCHAIEMFAKKILSGKNSQ